ncbi:hypothetical protein L598_000100001170 [Mesorhizobium sp. J18]|uniref:hypothetical protein n=1 Tax=Mesorhizobium sp. J18 TaxID=935263 RepID=UPI0011996CF4|nr:hypothetical protein [Mesorhizobium sp. J18]TWH01136.1 hypothetical protein L598_000100001170 [Mesorhizobium sp. J18]
MSILSIISHYVEAYRVDRQRTRTARLIGSLPAEIRKDIGWPGSYAPKGPRMSGLDRS